MAIKCAWASIDENGRARGGKAGDQTGRECKVGQWYYFGQDVIIRPNDTKRAKILADSMKILCAGNYVGYDQEYAGRMSLFEELKKVDFDASKMKKKCETDCSAMVAACLNCAGYKVSRECWTGNLKDACKAIGGFTILTASKYLKSGDYLKKGDIILNTKSHVIVALEDGIKAGSSVSTTKIKKITVDGSWGQKTTLATQQVFKTTKDGIISSQPSSMKKYMPSCDAETWQFKNVATGSEMVKAIQKLVGTKQTGKMNVATIEAMQGMLKDKGFYNGKIDSSMGALTVKAWQKYINSRL